MQTVPVVDPAFWNELERHILDWQAQPNEYLLCRRHTIPRWDSQERKNQKLPPDRIDRIEYRDQPMGVHGLHKWWYACLARAGVTAKGQTSGERMHKARHTARPARPRQDARQHQGRLEAARALVHLDDRRYLHGLGHLAA